MPRTVETPRPSRCEHQLACDKSGCANARPAYRGTGGCEQLPTMLRGTHEHPGMGIGLVLRSAVPADSRSSARTGSSRLTTAPLLVHRDTAETTERFSPNPRRTRRAVSAVAGDCTWADAIVSRTPPGLEPRYRNGDDRPVGSGRLAGSFGSAPRIARLANTPAATCTTATSSNTKTAT
jgi:hypothetical protein